MAEFQLSPEREQALARLKCAHCQSLMNCEALAQAIVIELQSRFPTVCRWEERTSDRPDIQLTAAVRAGIDRFFAELMDDAA